MFQSVVLALGILSGPTLPLPAAPQPVYEALLQNGNKSMRMARRRIAAFHKDVSYYLNINGLGITPSGKRLGQMSQGMLKDIKEVSRAWRHYNPKKSDPKRMRAQLHSLMEKAKQVDAIVHYWDDLEEDWQEVQVALDQLADVFGLTKVAWVSGKKH